MPLQIKNKPNVGICVRVRPILSFDKSADIGVVTKGQKLTLLDPRHKGTDREYDFDSIYNGNVTTQEIFDERIREALPGLFEGLNSTIFTHGATGSGKTYTMHGKNGKDGIAGMCIQQLIDITTQHPGQYRLQFSMFEIHRDKIRDLLRTDDAAFDLPMREDFYKTMQIAGLTQLQLSNLESLMKTYFQALGRRQVGKTSLNEESSRSHCCLRVDVEKIDEDAELARQSMAAMRGGMSHHVKGPKKQVGRLHLVDLAGCEDNRATGNRGREDRMAESCAINSSHFVLGKVLLALKKGESRVPFRDSKLTRLLKDSLGGMNHTFMLMMVNPLMVKFQATYNTFNAVQMDSKPCTTLEARGVAVQLTQGVLAGTGMGSGEEVSDKTAIAMNTFREQPSPQTKRSGGVPPKPSGVPTPRKRGMQNSLEKLTLESISIPEKVSGIAAPSPGKRRGVSTIATESPGPMKRRRTQLPQLRRPGSSNSNVSEAPIPVQKVPEPVVQPTPISNPIVPAKETIFEKQATEPILTSSTVSNVSSSLPAPNKSVFGVSSIASSVASAFSNAVSAASTKAISKIEEGEGEFVKRSEVREILEEFVKRSKTLVREILDQELDTRIASKIEKCVALATEQCKTVVQGCLQKELDAVLTRLCEEPENVLDPAVASKLPKQMRTLSTGSGLSSLRP